MAECPRKRQHGTGGAAHRVGRGECDAVQIFHAAAQGGHQPVRRVPAGLRGRSGRAGAGGHGEGHHRVRAVPVFRTVRARGGFLRPVGLHPEVWGRHHPHRQALPEAAAATAAPAEKGVVRVRKQRLRQGRRRCFSLISVYFLKLSFRDTLRSNTRCSAVQSRLSMQK